LNSGAEEAILNYLWKRGPGTIKQISRNLILSPGKVSRILKGLVAVNTVERIQDGDVEKFKARKAP
jgi:DNA-binding MarR family transcriptional regulator